MKKLLLAAVLSAATFTGVSQAQAEIVQFMGRLIVTGIAGTCPNDPTGQRLTARWKPAGIGDNGDLSNFATFRVTQAVAYRRTGPFDGTLRNVQSMTVTGDFGPLDYVAKISFNTISPATIDATTKFVNVTGKIKGFDFMPDCTASFRFAGVNRVND